MWSRAPVDSGEAREMREAAEAAAETTRAAQPDPMRDHADRCRGGWVGEDADGRPIPCRVCRPHLWHQACRTCSAPWQSCQALDRIRRGPCCPHCDHHRHPRPEAAGVNATPRPRSATSSTANEGGEGEFSAPMTRPAPADLHQPGARVDVAARRAQACP